MAGGGWPSYYIEEQHTNVQGMQGLVTSLVIEGVFEPPEANELDGAIISESA